MLPAAGVPTVGFLVQLNDQPTDDDSELRDVVKRLSRPHRSGGAVIERAAILAAGANSAAILRWIEAHAGEAEELAPRNARPGLHGDRMSGGDADPRKPLRYVLPPGALS
jgi:hypothetical protein